MEDAPAHRSEQPFGEEERCPDDREDAGHEHDRDRDPDEAGDLGHLAADRLGLGLGEIDVRRDQAHAGVTGRAERREHARWGRGLVGTSVVQGGTPGSWRRTSGAGGRPG
jgi:hypothetical protein